MLAALFAWLVVSIGGGGTVGRIADHLKRDAPDLDRRTRTRVARAVVDAGEDRGLDPLLLLAVIEIESTYDPDARSHAGGTGLMQLRLPTARAVAARHGLGKVDRERLHDVELNIRLGAAYLAELFEQFGDWSVALAAYHRGPTRIRYLQRVGRPLPTGYASRVLRRHDALRTAHAGV